MRTVAALMLEYSYEELLCSTELHLTSQTDWDTGEFRLVVMSSQVHGNGIQTSSCSKDAEGDKFFKRIGASNPSKKCLKAGNISVLKS